MKIIITGATGFVGRNLVKILKKNKVELLLVGRKKDKLVNIFPGERVCDYDELTEHINKFEILIHLAAINNNGKFSYEEFEKINVNLLYDIAKLSEDNKIKYLFNFSTFHIIDSHNKSDYAMTKEEGIKKISKLKKVKIFNLILPIIYSDEWSGKLKFLNSFPKKFAKIIFYFLSALKPTVSLNLVVKRIYEIIDNNVYENKNIIISEDISKNHIYNLFSKSIDFIFVLLSFTILIWLKILIYIFLKLSSSESALFAQKRVGFKQSIFTCYKFRTMKVDTPQKGTHEISSNSITKFGNFLRKFKLDELPQSFNIIKNEMTLIGPRPCLASQNELIRERNNKDIFSVKPGITGLAQINNIDMSNPKKLALWDERYVKMRCIILDIKIAINTLVGK